MSVGRGQPRKNRGERSGLVGCELVAVSPVAPPNERGLTDTPTKEQS